MPTRHRSSRIAALGLAAAMVLPATSASADVLPDSRTVAEQAAERRLVGAFVRPPGDDQTPERSEQEFSAREELVGRDLDIGQWFYPFERRWPTPRDLTHQDQGRIPLVSWQGVDTGDLVAGVHDDFLRERAEAAEAFGSPILVRFFRQMDLDSAGLVGSPEEFIAAWRRVVDIFRDAGADNAEFVWCPSAFGFTDAADDPAPDFYPGDEWVDWTCADGYDFAPIQFDRSKNLTQLFGDFHAWGSQRGKPMMVAEFGTLGAANVDKDDWLETASDQVEQLPGIRAWVYFDASGTPEGNDEDLDWRTNSSPETTAAWSAFVNDDAFGATVPRISGSDRVATSVALSRAAFDTADAVVVARADDFPDALAASPLASVLDAPLLVTDRTALDGRVAGEIARLGASEAWVVGGEAALSADVAQALEDADLTVRRLAGPSRFATAAEVAGAVVERTGAPDRATVASGAAFPDALVAANLAAIDDTPILLTRPDRLEPETRDALGSLLADGADVDVIGGAAAINDGVVAAIDDVVDGVDRLSGANRFDTAIAVADAAVARGASDDRVLVASGATFADAVSAGPAAAALGGVLLLTPADGGYGPLVDRVGDAEVGVVGGRAAVSEAARQALPARHPTP